MGRMVMVLVAGAVLACGQSLPVEPARESGSSVTGAFEGWFKNADGTFSLLLGYYNRNLAQELNIPIGPNNRIEPGGPDQGQPTYFMPGRGWGMFAVKVPADFGEGKVTWTLGANGKTTVIPAHLKPDYEISPLTEAAVGNTPPTVRFEEGGAAVQGPQGGITAERTAKLGSPFTLTAWVADDAKFTSSSGVRPSKSASPVTLRWIMYRGPGRVTFGDERPKVAAADHPDAGAVFSGKATTTVTFSEPGEYVLNLVANDFSGVGGAGFQCCWTDARIKVTVQP